MMKRMIAQRRTDSTLGFLSADDIFFANVALEDFAHRGDSIGHCAVRDAEFALKLTLRCAVEHSAEDVCQLRRLLFELPQKFAE